MPSAFSRFIERDAAKFVDPTLFGVAAIYTAGGQAVPVESTTINVSFSEPQVDAFEASPPAAEDLAPTALARTQDVPNARSGDQLDIEGTTYVVRDATPDGCGHTVLELCELDGYPLPLPPYAIASTYPGTGMTVPLSWSLATDGKRSGVRVWRTDVIADGEPVLVTTLGAAATSYVDTAPGASVYDYEVAAIGASGPSAGAGIGIQVNP